MNAATTRPYSFSLTLRRLFFRARNAAPKAWIILKRIWSVLTFLLEDEIERRREAKAAKARLKAVDTQHAAPILSTLCHAQ